MRSPSAWAFEQAGEIEHANGVKQTLAHSKGMGLPLAKYLMPLGWNAYYWNPDSTFSWDRRDFIEPESHQGFVDDLVRARRVNHDNPEPGANAWANEHSASYRTAKRFHTYYTLPITDMFVDYRPTPRRAIDKLPHIAEPEAPTLTATTLARTKLRTFGSRTKFGFGMARGGDHTFLFSRGFVYEVHWDGYDPM